VFLIVKNANQSAFCNWQSFLIGFSNALKKQFAEYIITKLKNGHFSIILSDKESFRTG